MNLIAYSGQTQIQNQSVNVLPIERSSVNEPARSFNDYLAHETNSLNENKSFVRNDDHRARTERNDAHETTEYRREADSALKNETSIRETNSSASEISYTHTSEHAKTIEAVKEHSHTAQEDPAVSRKKTSSKDSVSGAKDKTDDPLASLMQILAQMKIDTQGKAQLNPSAKSAVKERLSSLIQRLTQELAQLDQKGTDAAGSLSSDKIKKHLAFAKEITKLMDNAGNGALNGKNLSSRIESLTDRIASEMKRVQRSEDHSGARVQVASHSSSTASESRIDITKDLSRVSAADQSVASTQGHRSDSDSTDQQSGSFMKQFGMSRETSSARAANAASPSLPFAQKLDELIDKAQITMRDGKNGQLSMKMFPEHLGRVNVTLGLENGVLNAKFLVDNNEARTALTDSLNDLKGALENEGLSLGAFQVDVRGGENQYKSHESDDDFSVHFSRHEAEEAQLQYDRRQSTNHDGSINLVV